MSRLWTVEPQGPVGPSAVAGLRLADASVALEAGLAAADRRARATALDLLGRWFPTLPVDDLAQTTDAATVRLGPISPDLAASPLTDGTLLDRLFGGRGYGPENLKLVRNREHLRAGTALIASGSAGRSFPQLGALAGHLDAGYTAVLDAIDLRDEASMRLAEATERVFGNPVNINGYLSLRPQMSFGAHWDDQEVIVVQLVGSKHWAIEQPVALSMSKTSHTEATSGTVAWEGDLHVGQALYVPRGWGHRVTSDDDLSFHYTITIPRLNGVTALGQIIGRHAARRAGQRRVPTGADPDALATMAATWLAEAAGDEAVGWTVAQVRANTPSRSTQRLSTLRRLGGGAQGSFWVRSPVPGGWVVADAERAAGVVSVVVGGQQVRVAGEALDTLAGNGDGVARRLDLGASNREVVEALCMHGLLEVGEGAPGWGVAVSDEEPASADRRR